MHILWHEEPLNILLPSSNKSKKSREARWRCVVALLTALGQYIRQLTQVQFGALSLGWSVCLFDTAQFTCTFAVGPSVSIDQHHCQHVQTPQRGEKSRLQITIWLSAARKRTWSGLSASLPSPSPRFYLRSTHAAKKKKNKSVSLSVCFFFSFFCVMRVWKQWCAVFRSWIKPGQRPRGLQVNVAYFKRLFLHGHSVCEAHLHARAFWEKQKKKESLREKASGCGLQICLFLCVLLNQPLVCPYVFLFSLLFVGLWFLFLVPNVAPPSFCSALSLSILLIAPAAPPFSPCCIPFFLQSAFALTFQRSRLPPVKAISLCINDCDHWE